MSVEENVKRMRLFDCRGRRPRGAPLAIVFQDIVDGRVTRLAADFDQVGMMRQLGALPA